MSRRAGFFIVGDLTLLLALCSPIDTLGDTYLFSAHMLQHMLLILAVPPLLIAGLSNELVPAFARRAKVSPLLAWTLGIGAMWIWHWPPLYNAALASEPVHIIEHLLFLITSTLFWLPILSPVDQQRLEPPAAMVYLFAACIAHTILAILITFAPVGLYPAYIHPSDDLRMLPLIRDQWGLNPASDQQVGGLLMWVPACLVYLSFILGALARWYREAEQAPIAAQQKEA